MSNYQYLFTPLKVGSQVLPNRIIMSPHSTNYPRGSEQEIAYYCEKARGGAGTIILESTMVIPGVTPLPMAKIYSEEFIPENQRIIEALHKLGAKVIIEAMTVPGVAGNSQPSNHLGVLSSNIAGRSQTAEEIKSSVQEFAQSVVYAQKAGADGIHLYASCGCAEELFLSPLFNRRTDEYGGSLENRMRFLTEVIDAIRKLCGKDFLVGVNVNVDQSMMGGYALEEGVEIARLLAETKKVDYLGIDSNNCKSRHGNLHYPASYLPAGLMLGAAAAVREVVDIPVFGSHKINTAEMAEQALAEGQCDAVLMARALIADPEMPNKAKRGETEEIRACIGCVEGCYQRYAANMPMGCTVNPGVGEEYLGNTIVPAEKKKKVVVVGGGLAGMETARMAANRGHEVVLLEKTDELGGHVNLLSQLPGLSDRSDIVRWLTLQMDKEKMDLRFNTEATPELIQSLNPDTVVVAAGSNYSELGITQDVLYPIPGYDADYVLTPEKVILEDQKIGQRVVVYDTTDYIVGPGLAERFAEQGKEVTLITSSSSVAESLASSFVNWTVASRVLPKVNYIRDTAITNIDNHVLSLQNRYTYEESQLDGIDTVVLVNNKIGNQDLYNNLVGKVPEIHIIGDANQAHYGNMGMDAAYKSGHTTGKII